MKNNKTQIKARKILFVIIITVVVLPLTIFFTNLLINRPKTARVQNAAVSTKPISQDNLNGEIIDNISFRYQKPDKNWSHTLIKKEKNQYDKLFSYEYEFSNGTSKINFLVVEEDIAYLQYTTRNPNYTSNELNGKLLGYVDNGLESTSIFMEKGSIELSRIDNIRLGSGQIMVERKNQKDKKLQSNLQLFSDYKSDYKQQLLYTQITYNQDTSENYKVMDRLIKSINYKAIGS
jgi:hypothetical protein